MAIKSATKKTVTAANTPKPTVAKMAGNVKKAATVEKGVTNATSTAKKAAQKAMSSPTMTASPAKATSTAQVRKAGKLQSLAGQRPSATKAFVNTSNGAITTTKKSGGSSGSSRAKKSTGGITGSGINLSAAPSKMTDYAKQIRERSFGDTMALGRSLRTASGKMNKTLGKFASKSKGSTYAKKRKGAGVKTKTKTLI